MLVLQLLKLYMCGNKLQEEEKERLMGETGLDMKQLNNWFINQRKRNWSTSLACEWKETGKVLWRIWAISKLYLYIYIR